MRVLFFVRLSRRRWSRRVLDGQTGRWPLSFSSASSCRMDGNRWPPSLHRFRLFWLDFGRLHHLQGDSIVFLPLLISMFARADRIYSSPLLFAHFGSIQVNLWASTDRDEWYIDGEAGKFILSEQKKRDTLSPAVNGWDGELPMEVVKQNDTGLKFFVLFFGFFFDLPKHPSIHCKAPGFPLLFVPLHAFLLYQ